MTVSWWVIPAGTNPWRSLVPRTSGLSSAHLSVCRFRGQWLGEGFVRGMGPLVLTGPILIDIPGLLGARAHRI